MSTPVALTIVQTNPIIAKLVIETGVPGADGREVQMRVNNDDVIQWRYAGVAEWTDLVDLSEGDMQGPGISVDGRIALFDGTTGKFLKQAGQAIADLLARGNHTGTQLAETISDFVNAAVAAVTWNTITGKPATFTPSAHTHPISEVTGLQDSLDGKSTTGHTHDASAIVSGTLDAARIPVLPSQVQIVSSGDLTDLTTEQKDEIGQGTVVTTTDGRRWVYSGTGDKETEASYVELADITPDWSVVSDKPATFAPSAHASAHVTGGGDKIRDATAAQDGLMTAAYATKVDGIAAGAQVNDAAAAIKTKLETLSGAARLDASAVQNLPGAWIVKTGNYNAVAGDRIIADVTSGGFTITLPATPTAADVVEILIHNSNGYWLLDTSLTVARNGSNINGSAANFSFASYARAFTYVAGYGWKTHSTQLNVHKAPPPDFSYDCDWHLGGRYQFIGQWSQSRLAVTCDSNKTQSWWGPNITYSSDVIVGWGNSPNFWGGSGDVSFRRVEAGVAGLNGGGTSNGGVLEIGAVASLGTPSSGCIRVGNIGGEAYVCDASGNVTLFSPHATDEPEHMRDSASARIGFEIQLFAGYVRYTNFERLQRGRSDAIWVETLEAHNARTGKELRQLVWEDVQAGYMAESQERRAQWAAQRDDAEADLAAWLAMPEGERKGPQPDAFATPEPALHVALAAPAWIAEQMAELPAILEAQQARLLRRSWSQREFWAHFTQAEQLSIVLSTDPFVMLLRYTLSLHPEIWSDDERVIGGLGHCVSIGLLKSERPAQILG